MEALRQEEVLGPSPAAHQSTFFGSSTSSAKAPSFSPIPPAGAREERKKDRKMSASVGRTRVGRYELGRTLGEGTFAKVKFARNVETGENVAIKILDKEKVLKHKMIAQVKHAIDPLFRSLSPSRRSLFLLCYVFPVPFSSFFSPHLKIRARTKKFSLSLILRVSCSIQFLLFSSED